VKAVVVGFGGMGCRHASSLYNGKQFHEIWILEPNKNFFIENCTRIGIPESEFKHVTEIESLPDDINFAVIATTSIPRLSIFKILAEVKGIKYFLLEKVVFQSKFQFNEAIDFINKFNINAYCNFVNRYFPNYQKIKHQIDNNKPFNMIVSGGEFGLGCNSLHYIDLFQFISSSKPNLINYSLSENLNTHKRGSSFKEVTGQMLWKTSSGDTLIINSQIEKAIDVEITIQYDDNVDILNEGAQTHCKLYNSTFSNSKFEMLFTSYLTNVIFNDIINGICLLPKVEETFNIHAQLFDIFNKTIGLAENDNCPIT
jgi:hypothetical protein